MNIIITLPCTLVNAILNGTKSVEIRSKIPARFNIDEDVVFVVEKGTRRVPFYFSIKQFSIYKNCHEAVRDNIKYAGVCYDWLVKYTQSKPIICVWVIGRVCRLLSPKRVYETLEIKHNPESFNYTEVEVSSFYITEAFWSKRVHSEEKSSVFMPDKRFEIVRIYDESCTGELYYDWCENHKIPQNWRGAPIH